MDKDEELLKILGKLSGGRIEDVADKIIALFRAPEWWEEEFDAKFVARGSIIAFQDAETRDAVKSFISALLTRAQQEERQKLIRDIESLRDAFFTDGDSPADKSSAMKLYAFLLSDLRQKYGTDFSVQRLQPVSMRFSRLHPMKVLVIPGLPDRQSANSASD